MIDDSKEWLAALLSSGIIRFYREDSDCHPCRDCGKPLIIGTKSAKLCLDCANEKRRVMQRGRPYKPRPKREALNP